MTIQTTVVRYRSASSRPSSRRSARITASGSSRSFATAVKGEKQSGNYPSAAMSIYRRSPGTYRNFEMPGSLIPKSSSSRSVILFGPKMSSIFSVRWQMSSNPELNPKPRRFLVTNKDVNDDCCGKDTGRCCCCCCCDCCSDSSSDQAVQLLRELADVIEDTFVDIE